MRTRLIGLGLTSAVLGLSGFAGVSCQSSGHDGVTAVAESDCGTCHKTEYLRATQPVHVGLFPQTCSKCHTNVAWKPAMNFDHARYFPLEGAHQTAACRDCHTDGFKAGATPKDCVGCHQKDYDNSPFPGHDAFATTCADCHAASGWTPAMIPNHDQFFPLDGKHATIACASCHVNGYAPGATPKDCVGCHKKDYDNSPFPGHSAFATTCHDCHSTTAWTPASGGHPESAFPIKSGAHKNIACADCHDSALGSAKDNPDCVGCHTGQHTRSRLDPKHSEVRGYPTGSAAPGFCLDCHPNGRNN